MKRGRLKSSTAQKAIGILSLLCPSMSIELPFSDDPLLFPTVKYQQRHLPNLIKLRTEFLFLPAKDGL